MGRPIRQWQAGRLYFVTHRTIQGRLLLRPSPQANDLIGGILAKGVADFGIKLYGFVVLSNHIHLIISHDTTGSRISDFMQWTASLIARKVGRLTGWRDKFWGRRFSAEPILDDDAALARLRYIFAHGVKEGLVERAANWPGLTCIPELTEGRRRCFPWDSWTKLLWARLRGATLQPGEYRTYYDLRLAPLPALASTPEAERRRLLTDLLAAAEAEARATRGEQPALGVDAVLSQDPHTEAQPPERRPRPLCHASTLEVWFAFRAAWRQTMAAYREASAQWRTGSLAVEFPVGTYPPARGFTG